MLRSISCYNIRDFNRSLMLILSTSSISLISLHCFALRFIRHLIHHSDCLLHCAFVSLTRSTSLNSSCVASMFAIHPSLLHIHHSFTLFPAPHLIVRAFNQCSFHEELMLKIHPLLHHFHSFAFLSFNYFHFSQSNFIPLTANPAIKSIHFINTHFNSVNFM